MSYSLDSTKLTYFIKERKVECINNSKSHFWRESVEKRAIHNSLLLLILNNNIIIMRNIISGLTRGVHRTLTPRSQTLFHHLGTIPVEWE